MLQHIARECITRSNLRADHAPGVRFRFHNRSGNIAAAHKLLRGPMRVLIVDDHPIIASGCRALLAGDPDIENPDAGDAESGEQVFLAEKPDVSVLDINLPASRVSSWRGAFSGTLPRPPHHVQHER